MPKVVLGLGSNLGAKLDYLRKAVDLIDKRIAKIIATSKIYQTSALLPQSAPVSWNIDYYNMALLIETTLEPQALLLGIKAIETEMGRDALHAFWSPREIDIDILCYGDVTLSSDALNIPHKALLERNFALKPLLEVYPNWRYPNKDIDLYEYLKKMEKLKLAPFTLSATQIMAIVNLSIDSFSAEEAQPPTVDEFAGYVMRLIEEGAEVIDLGTESTKPQVKAKTAEKNWLMLQPYLIVLDELIKYTGLSVTPKVSIDTYHAQVVENALHYSCVNMINDVYGIEAQAIANLIKGADIKYVFMHQLGKAATNYLDINRDPVLEVIEYAQQRIADLMSWGMKKEQLIFDIGIGFGKHDYQARALLKHVDKIKSALGVEILIGHSRKSSVMRVVEGKSNLYKDIATAMIAHELIQKNVDYLRVHNVDLTNMARQI
ncbi:dihydropteroate synthase [Fastidiosibacter lacustris]|uniref:dihydropteroate synthase n=1 Tax=Fastidiosibacter lacustris TaxID=2056695 RepID=UPI000E351B9E|nr:dihydropteroate synthase [Fastidiosibacter lacustris]